MDQVTFRAGVSLLTAEEARVLDLLMRSIADPEERHTQASVFIRSKVDPVELVRTATAARAGLIQLSDVAHEHDAVVIAVSSSS